MKLLLIALLISQNSALFATTDVYPNRSLVIFEHRPDKVHLTFQSRSELLLGTSKESHKPNNLTQIFRKFFAPYPIFRGGKACQWFSVNGYYNQVDVYLRAKASCPVEHEFIEWDPEFFKSYPSSHRVVVSFMGFDKTVSKIQSPHEKIESSDGLSSFDAAINGLHYSGLSTEAWKSSDSGMSIPDGFWIVLFSIQIVLMGMSPSFSIKILAGYLLSMFLGKTFAAMTGVTIAEGMALVTIGATQLMIFLHSIYRTDIFKIGVWLTITGFLQGIASFQLAPDSVKAYTLANSLAPFQIGAFLGIIGSLVLIWPVTTWTLQALPERKYNRRILRGIFLIAGLISLII
ncbi:MAG: hypothetical protein HRU19_22640 [Pseudobacteriovorax sp.]|nr:hypothetical protein [Pseudobacteriovorax sp.]